MSFQHTKNAFMYHTHSASTTCWQQLEYSHMLKCNEFNTQPDTVYNILEVILTANSLTDTDET